MLELWAGWSGHETSVPKVPRRQEPSRNGADRVALVPELAHSVGAALGEVMQEAVKGLVGVSVARWNVLWDVTYLLGKGGRDFEGKDTHRGPEGGVLSVRYEQLKRA